MTVDIKNKTFGCLRPMWPTNKRLQNSIVWICKCSCGSHTKRSVKELRRKGPPQKCRCKKVPAVHAVGDISVRWWSQVCKVTGSKKRKGLSKTLTTKQAWWLFQEQEQKCVYSGVPLVISLVRSDNTASIDRINSDLGYDLCNVQWVHKEVNMMKRILTHDQFVNWCGLISKYQEAKK